MEKFVQEVGKEKAAEGYLPQKYGASITAIVDPDTDDLVQFVQCFAGSEEAADYLNFKRKRLSSGSKR